MKKLLVYVAAAALLAACGTSEPVKVQQGPDPREAYFAAVASCAATIKDIAVSAGGAGEASKVAAVGAVERLCGGGGGGSMVALLQSQQVQQAPPASVAAVLWNAALQTADVVLRGYGIKSAKDVAVTQSNNATVLGVSTNQAFVSMGGSIERAGIAGYPYVQAPGAVTNTTNTLSGTGVLGSGTYIGPVTRTCSGGGAGNSGGTAGGAGGPGGAATC